MSSFPKSVAGYYATLSGEHLETIVEMRSRILAVIPDATEAMKYGMPTFFVDGTAVCGLLSNKKHIGFYPYSGSLLGRFPEIIEKYVTTKGALHVPLNAPLPKSMVKNLIRAKLSDCEIVNRSAAPATASDAEWKALGLAAPARRALINAKILKLSQLAKHREADVAALHGMGPNALKTIKAAMKTSKITFKK